MESEGEINLSLELKISEGNSRAIRRVNNLLQNLKFNINTKQNVNKEKTKSRVEMITLWTLMKGKWI